MGFQLVSERVSGFPSARRHHHFHSYRERGLEEGRCDERSEKCRSAGPPSGPGVADQLVVQSPPQAAIMEVGRVVKAMTRLSVAHSQGGTNLVS